MNLASVSLSGLALCALLAGCHRHAADAGDEQLTGDGTLAMASSAQSTHLASVVFASVTQKDPERAADDVAGKPTALYPLGCVTRAKDPTNPKVAHLEFHDCAGPLGLVHLDGGESVTFSQKPDGMLEAQIAGDDLTAGGEPITFTATADITIEGASRHVAWSGEWTIVDPAGVTVTHTSELTVDVDTAVGCRAINGNARTEIGEREVDSTISDLESCLNPDGAEACPEGKITHTAKASHESITIELDGSDHPSVTGPAGRTWDVALVCPAYTGGAT